MIKNVSRNEEKEKMIINNESLIKGIYEMIVERVESEYRNLFNNIEMKNIDDRQWKRALEIYNEFSDEDKESFFRIIKQVEIDTLSYIFGVFDGTSSFEDGEVSFDIRLEGSSEVLNCMLQDLFLEYVEEHYYEGQV